MSDQENQPNGNGEDPGRVVYRRVDDAEARLTDNAAGRGSGWESELSPALIPLIGGFVLLLILVLTVGFISVKRMDEVGQQVLNLEQQHAAKLSELLKL